MEFGRKHFRTFERGTEKEWLITNGIGGYACSTISGANTRRYHGLLIASLKPPTMRHLILSSIEESFFIDGSRYELAAFRTPGFTAEGYKYLEKFEKNPFPKYSYRVAGLSLEKSICMTYGKNTVSVVYHVVNGETSAVMRITPIVNYRDHHYESKSKYMDFKESVEYNSVTITPYNLENKIRLYCDTGMFTATEGCTFYNMEYPVEGERGLAPSEDHYMPGYYEISLKPYDDRYITFVASTENEFEKDGLITLKNEQLRINEILKKANCIDDFDSLLVRAADDFIVYRQSTNAKTIIAGYPWFTDWGRDTMIAFPGITLATGRYEDAKEILLTFSKYVKDGLIPNVFPDEGESPAYNSVDAALWYFEAAKKYIEYTGDSRFVIDNLYSSLQSIVENFINGTLFDIKVTEDGLVSAGNETTQLTWMDAKVDDWVVTPRHGKAVEINALWYNALMVMAQLNKFKGWKTDYYKNLAKKTRESFIECFWNEKDSCLYDVVIEQTKDSKIRPNQIMAVSLSFPVLEGEKAKCVVDCVWNKLYTPYGLRTLSSDSKQYRGVYSGDRLSRDGAYHQGTVWPWLMGSFMTGFLRVYGNDDKVKQTALSFITPFFDHLYDACLGSISEIFDGDFPHWPRGAFAQAWSVGEILRVYRKLIS